MGPSFVDQLVAWWRQEPAVTQRERGSTRVRRPSSIEAVGEKEEEIPNELLSELQEEQGRVAQELEETFQAYDEKLRAMAERLAGRRGRSGEGMPTARELARIREEQLILWRWVRRAQAALRSTRQLEREWSEWRGRAPGAAEVGHPDHPDTRLELLRSELTVRGVTPSGGRSIAAPISVPMRMETASEPVETVEVEAMGSVDADPEWPAVSDDNLLRALYSHQREIGKLFTVIQDPAAAEEVAAFARELRELHAHLRKHDRSKGISRERWQMGIPLMR